MSLSNPKRLVKIFVIENPLTCVSFLQRDYVLSRTIYCSKRYAHSIIHQHEKCAIHRTQGNRAFVGWGDPTYLFLGLFSFFSQVVHLCNLFITQLRCRYPWIVFFSGHSLKLWRRGRSRKLDKHNKQKVQFQRLLEVVWRRRKELSTNNRKRHSPGCSSISLSKQRFTGLKENFLPPVLKGQCQWALNGFFFYRSCNLNQSILTLVCPMPHLLALFSIVKI